MSWNEGEIKTNWLSAQVIYQPSDFWKSVKKLAYAHCEQKEQIQKHYLLIYCYVNELHFFKVKWKNNIGLFGEPVKSENMIVWEKIHMNNGENE